MWVYWCAHAQLERHWKADAGQSRNSSIQKTVFSCQTEKRGRGSFGTWTGLLTSRAPLAVRSQPRPRQTRLLLPLHCIQVASELNQHIQDTNTDDEDGHGESCFEDETSEQWVERGHPSLQHYRIQKTQAFHLFNQRRRAHSLINQMDDSFMPAAADKEVTFALSDISKRENAETNS